MAEIIINLSNSSDARNFNDGDQGDLIHQPEFKKVTGWIEGRIAQIKDRNAKVKRYHTDTDSKVKERPHDAITILGTRGSGKTSFLLSLITKYEESNDIAVLRIIDPTLIEEKGHVFLTIISCIKAEVEKMLDKNESNPSKNTFGNRKTWLEKLKRLSDGLPSIDGVGRDFQQDSWQDPEFIMNKGVRQVTSATYLEEYFDDFVSFGLDILDRRCFLLFFDDIDIDFRKGWTVLETVRKYLTSRKIIVVLSGDMKLFSLGIRKQQWQNFGKALLKNEGDALGKIAMYNDRVTEMEGQYMQKVMKPEQRVHLSTLYEKLKPNSKGSIVKVKMGSDTKDIKLVYDEILTLFGIKNFTQRGAYRSFLLSLPLRTQVQFLSEFETYEKRKKISTSANQHNIVEMHTSDAFLSYMYEKEVDVDLALGSPRFLCQIILTLLIKEKYLSEGYQLQPTSTNTSLNGSFAALSFIFSMHSESNPYLIFDYLVKIGYTRNLFGGLGYESEREESYSDDKKAMKGSYGLKRMSVEGLVKHAGLNQDRHLQDFAARITAYVRGKVNLENGQKKLANGTIPLKTLTETRKINYKDRIDYEFPKTDERRHLAYLPLSIFQYSSKNSSNVTYSVFKLLGAVGELLRQFQENEGFSADLTLENENTINTTLVTISEIQTYPMPEFLSGEVEEFEDDETGDEGPAEDRPTLEQVRSLLFTWLRAFPKKKTSPHLLGKIATRFFFSLLKIEQDANKVAKMLGEVMHSEVVAFLNAVLIEDAKEFADDISGLNMSNTISDDRFFIANLTRINTLEIDNQLSKWILCCPLLLVFLNIRQGDPLYVALRLYVEDLDLIIAQSIYEKMDKIALYVSTAKKVPKKEVAEKGKMESSKASMELPLDQQTK